MKNTIGRLEVPPLAVGGLFEPTGTAFLISPSRVATSLHVLNGAANVRITFVSWLDDGVRDATLEWVPEGKDLAILRLNRPCPDTVEPIPLGPIPMPGSQWSTFGFPTDLVDGHTLIDNKIVDPRQFIAALEHTVIQLETPAAQFDLGGMSGAPCIVDQRVVGVISYQLVRSLSIGSRSESVALSPSLHTLYAIPSELLAGGTLENGKRVEIDRTSLNTPANGQFEFEDLVRVVCDLYADPRNPGSLWDILKRSGVRPQDHSEPLLLWYHVLVRIHQAGELGAVIATLCDRYPRHEALSTIDRQFKESPKVFTPPGIMERTTWQAAAAIALPVCVGALALATTFLSRAGAPLALLATIAYASFTVQQASRHRRLREEREARAAEGFVKRERRTAFRWLAAFEDDDLLPGESRRAAAATIAGRLSSSDFRVGVLSGLVGCGKTSFMRSELKRRVKAAGYQVVFIARPRELDANGPALEASTPQSRMRLLEARVAEALKSTGPVFLLIDQTEEFFVDHTTREAVEAMTAAFARLVSQNVRILCAIRHDFLLPMHHLSPTLPPLVFQQNLFELREFDIEQATEVITDCAFHDRIRIEPGSLARTIADELATGNARTVRPPELQIVCSSLGHDFKERRYRAAGGWRGLIAGYIQRSIEMCADPRVAARALRQLCDFTPAIRNARPAQTAQDVAAAINAPPDLVALILETMTLERLVRRVDRDRFALMHDYLVDPVGRATKNESTAAEEASLLLGYHITLDASRRFEPIPLRRLAFVRRHASQLAGGEPAARRVFRRSVVTQAARILGAIVVAGTLVMVPTYGRTLLADCAHGEHVRGEWYSPACVRDYSWEHHDGVDAIANGAYASGADEQSFVICRVLLSNEWNPGYLSSTGCHYEWGGNNLTSVQYDALTGPSTTQWAASSDGKSVPGAFLPSDKPGRQRGICRARRRGKWVAGKLLNSGCTIPGEDPSAAAPDGREQLALTQYEVLLAE